MSADTPRTEGGKRGTNADETVKQERALPAVAQDQAGQDGKISAAPEEKARTLTDSDIEHILERLKKIVLGDTIRGVTHCFLYDCIHAIEQSRRAPASASPPELEALKEQVNHWYMLYHAAADQIEQSMAAPRFTPEEREALDQADDALGIQEAHHFGMNKYERHAEAYRKIVAARATIRAMLSPQGKGGDAK